MPSFRTARQVRHSPQEMFDLVADVEKYPEFLPLCEGLKVRRRAESGEGVETLVAEMRVGYKAIQEAFTTRVTLDRTRLRILVEYVDGPFSYLENRWSFHPDPAGRPDAGCTVEFYISYEFKSFALGLLMGTVFDKAFRKFVQAFEERADRIYGRERTTGVV
jgi:coenzyme Q-binding protein COQ10